MPFILDDRVLEISTTTGTGPLTLAGAPSGYQTFLSGIGGSNTTYYAVFNTVANEWELGLGTLNAGATELTRTTVYSSSNSNLAVNFSAGTKNVFVTVPASRIISDNGDNTFTGNNTYNGTSRFNGNVGIGIAPSATSELLLAAGTATVAPATFTSGTNLTSPAAGVVEYDGVRFYGTTDTTSGRGYIPSIQIFRLTANGAAIGPGISNFFGANSAISLVGGGAYELEAYCYFTKTTAGTVTVTLTASAAVVNLNGTVDYGAAAGGVATGAANRISLFASAATANAFGASASLTTAVNHAFIVRAVFDANAANSNLRIDFTSSAGTVTPLRNSYYKITRLPAGNSGSYAA